MRAIDRFPWSKSGWLPELQVIRWPALERRRGEHEKAVAAYEKDGDGTGAALTLLDAVEAAVKSLDLTFEAKGEDGWRASYEQERETHDRADLRGVPVAGPQLDAWIEANADDERVDAAKRRLQVREDADAIAQLRETVLGRDRWLRAGRILKRVEVEVAEAREAIGKSQAAA
jgi:hypothetical protein